jgi:CP family cyanate transporter-like MFS transporter
VLLVLLAVIAWIPQLSRVHTITYTPTETVWRNRIAWAITVFMGAQSLVFYSFTAWLPALLIDQGYSRAAAGTVLALGQLAGLVGSLLVPMVAARYADQRAATFVAIAVSVAGLVGLLATDRWAALWSMLLGFGPGASISLAVLFMVLRSRTPAQTGQVSGMSQSIGYILAAFGPIAVGALHDATGSWNVAFAVLGVGLLAQFFSASLAARNVRMAP